jgi:four helix bundle protein
MKEELKRRTKKIGLKVIALIDHLPNKPSGWAIAKQIVRSATSIGANYRAACRAKSTADFIYKLKIVEEEADEKPSFGSKSLRKRECYHRRESIP